MRIVILLALMIPTIAQASENRCGWFENPTPANAWLIDRDGQWIIGVQGGHQADGDWPETGEWVASNGSYGYGCACAKVETTDGRVLKIISSKPLPLRTCRADPALKGKEPEGAAQ